MPNSFNLGGFRMQQRERCCGLESYSREIRAALLILIAHQREKRIRPRIIVSGAASTYFNRSEYLRVKNA
jgi:hypothetical protein